MDSRTCPASPVLSGAAALAAALAFWACGDVIAPSSAPDGQRPRPNLAINSGSCGVSFTAVVTDEDALLAAYGIPTTTDTMQVCETWTGSDYVMEETTVGSAWNAWRDADSAQTVVYSNGQITGYAADGGSVHAPVPAGPTAFDYMQVDAETRQASYDDPYYAVYSDGGGSCGGLDCRIQRPAGAITPSMQVVASADADTGKTARKFTKHGLKRRGVRALVDGATEIGRSAAGHRRFRKQRGDAEVVLTLDSTTELLIGEETTTPRGTTKATHRWKRGGRSGGDYVRERTEIECTEMIGGRPLRSRTTIELLDVTLGNGGVPAADSSISSPRFPR